MRTARLNTNRQGNNMKIIMKLFISALLLLIVFCMTGFASVTYGSEGEEVLNLQTRLSELGYFIGELNGFYGERTKTAVFNFQKANGIVPTGIFDPYTNQKLGEEGAVTKQQYIENSRKTPVFDMTLMQDDKGEFVKKLQQYLFNLGYFSDEITGNYGSVTKYAVSVFQLVNKLPVTGDADSATLTKLVSPDAIAVTEYGDKMELEFGDSGADVKELQNTLTELGYFAGDCTGRFGVNTQEAVLDFQKCNGLEQTGKCGIPMRILLIGGTAVSKSEAAAMEAVRSVVIGETSEPVITIKEQLTALGYYAGEINSEYTHELSEAVYYFQLANGLQTNGNADSATRLLLNSGVGKTKSAYVEELKKIEASSGANGYHVVILQERLNALGYYSGAFTGNYDQKTADAVIMFQRGHQLSETGAADAKTLSILYSEDAIGYSKAKELYFERKAEEKRQQSICSVCDKALACVSIPYEAGKAGPEKYGSAGLVYAIFKSADVLLQPTVNLQYEEAKLLESWNEEISAVQRGDQVFLRKDDTLLTGICVGDGLIVYASPEYGRVVAAENILETGEYEFVGSVAYI